MGANASKAADSGPDTNRKSLRPRSSFDILQRTRTPSASTRVNSRTTEASGPPPAYVSVDGTGPSGISSGNRDDVAHASRPSSAAISVPCDSTVGSDKASRSSYSTSSTATPATATEETEETSVDEESSDSSRHATPVPIPRMTLPTTFVLPEDSPTKYGLRTAQTPSPELSLLQAQRMKMSPGALFQHAATQIKVHQSQPSHKDVFKDEALVQVAHALPLRPSQLKCVHHHDKWHKIAKPGKYQVYPVACAVCDGYEAPGDDFNRCHWCWLIACGDCQKALVMGRVSGMMERQKNKA